MSNTYQLDEDYKELIGYSGLPHNYKAIAELASSVIKQAIKDKDIAFLKSKSCEFWLDASYIEINQELLWTHLEKKL